MMDLLPETLEIVQFFVLSAVAVFASMLLSIALDSLIEKMF